MISLDQVYLLEQKVESAVEKIQQLQAENDALRNKCTELTNALSVKSEQLSNFESDQSQIENGIKKALDRLNSIENSVLKNAAQKTQAVQAAPLPQAAAQPATPVQPAAAVQKAPQQEAPSFDTMDEVPQASEEAVEETSEKENENVPKVVDAPDFSDNEFEGEDEMAESEDDNHDGLGFDIF